MVCIYVNKTDNFLHKVLYYGFKREKRHLKGLFGTCNFSCVLSVLRMCQRVHKLSQVSYWEAWVHRFDDDIWNSLLLFQICRSNVPFLCKGQNKDAQKIGPISEVLSA